MPRIRLTAAVAGVGLLLAAAAALALAAGALQPAAVFGALAVAHVLVALGARRSIAVAALGGLVGLLEIALVAVGFVFILGVELGIGRVDLGDAWFAPLNGYAVIAVATAIVVVALGLVAQAARAIFGLRRRTDAAA
jgi:hypothetical protein